MGTMNSINWPASNVWVFMDQLVEHCSANAQAMGSSPVEAPQTFLGLLCDCLNRNHTCYDHFFIGQFGRYHNTLCLSPHILHKHCFQFLLGLIMVPRENKNNTYAKFGGTNKEYYVIFRTGLFPSYVHSSHNIHTISFAESIMIGHSRKDPNVLEQRSNLV